jgi:WhiB family redox-sensing transcriptional regulator
VTAVPPALPQPPSTPWRLLATCSDPLITLDTFFPRRATGGIAAPAKAICHRCPVAVDCLREGIKEPAGVWGGLAEKERREAYRLQQEGWELEDIHFYLTTRPPKKRGRKWPAAPVSELRIKIEIAWQKSIAS